MFSGAVKIQNQSDFIAPSQACVVALNGTRLDTKKIDAEEYVRAARPRKKCSPVQALQAAWLTNGRSHTVVASCTSRVTVVALLACVLR